MDLNRELQNRLVVPTSTACSVPGRAHLFLGLFSSSVHAIPGKIVFIGVMKFNMCQPLTFALAMLSPFAHHLFLPKPWQLAPPPVWLSEVSRAPVAKSTLFSDYLTSQQHLTPLSSMSLSKHVNPGIWGSALLLSPNC